MRRIYYQDQEIVYTLKRTRRRRSVALQVTPSGAVVVLAPRSAWSFVIERWVQKRAGWIAGKLREVRELAERFPSKRFVDGEPFPVWGSELPLRLISDPKASGTTCQRDGGQLVVRGGSEAGVVRAALQEWYSAETSAKLPDLLAKAAALLAVTPRSVKVVNQKSRWGSCSARGDIRFNNRLSSFPAFVMDYVVVHELAHLKAHNHSRRFWAIVAAVKPDYQKTRSWLRQNSRKYTLF